MLAVAIASGIWMGNLLNWWLVIRWGLGLNGCGAFDRLAWAANRVMALVAKSPILLLTSSYPAKKICSLGLILGKHIKPRSHYYSYRRAYLVGQAKQGEKPGEASLSVNSNPFLFLLTGESFFLT
jgi:hypothetical protein